MIRFGIVDLGTSHVVQFTMRLNKVDIAEEQFVDGGQVVMACRGASECCDDEKMDDYAQTLAGYGVEMVENAEDMIGKIDAVMIETGDSSVHLERARPFLEAGIPTWVDKPFAPSVADANEMVALAKKHGAPIFSCSSLRYTLELQELLADTEGIGDILGAFTFSPASLHERNPGLGHYGIHAVEPLYALMGPGCESVWCAFTEGAEVVTGLWADGRLGTLRGTRAGKHAYGFSVWGEKDVRHCTINVAYIYREVLKRIVEMVQTGEAPVPIEETVEIVKFMEAAIASKQNDGARALLA